MNKALLSVIALSATTLLAGCGQTEPQISVTTAPVHDAPSSSDAPSLEHLRGTTVDLFNWGLFLEDSLIQDFYDETGIRVVQSFYASNEEMYAVYTAGGRHFDMMIPSDYMVYRMIAEGLLRPLNWDNLYNSHHVGPYLMGHSFDDTNTFSVPYKWGTVGIAYNTTMVAEPITSWSSMFDPAYAGQILMYYSERDAFVPPLMLLGASVNTTDPATIEAARDMLIEQAPLVQAYVTDQVIGMMISGEAAMALVYSGDATWISYYNPDVNFVIPDEGSNIWINSMVIPASANNPEGAEAFMNFLLRPEVAVINTNTVGYTTANLTAIQSGNINPGFTALESFAVHYDDFARLESFIDLGAERELITQAFIEVLAAH